MEQTVYMVRHKETGMFWKKGHSIPFQGPKDISKAHLPLWFTDKMGRARIFESEKVARNTLPSWSPDTRCADAKPTTWETMGTVEIIPVRMVIE